MQEDNQQNINQDTSVEQLQKDLEIANGNYKRALADFENYKRRKEAENKELIEFAREVVVAKLLPTLDALSQALKHLPKFDEQKGEEGAKDFFKKYIDWQTGMGGIVNQLEKAFLELGVKKIEALGKKFDPHLHEAVREVESDEEDGVILEEFQTGFELNGKTLRPSQVVISKKKLI